MPSALGSATDDMRGALGVLDDALLVARRGDESAPSGQPGVNVCAERRDLFSGVEGACMMWYGD